MNSLLFTEFTFIHQKILFSIKTSIASLSLFKSHLQHRRPVVSAPSPMSH